ncbi:MAG: TylF/MycF family methyltransferase [Nitrospinae bacterium]|nr:TylF/MycF family methyltransferase [Nitrospinota bacterium]
MHQKPEQLYLDLMKKTLSFTLWPEPPLPITTFYIRSPVKRFLVSAISKVLDKRKLLLVQKRDFSQSQRIEGRVWPVYADTMIGLKRLDNLQYCVETVLREGVEGHLIETGAWRGGACIFMRAVLAAYGIANRKVFVADSFEGLPKPDDRKYPADKGDKHHIHTYLAVSKEDVENNFRKYGLLDDQVVFLKGWFKDTLPNAPIEKLSILRLDGDMYGSTMESLEYLYPKLSNGGFCIIDDYALRGCQMAVDDYRSKHQINSEMKEIDWTGRYWRKE